MVEVALHHRTDVRQTQFKFSVLMVMTITPVVARHVGAQSTPFSWGRSDRNAHGAEICNSFETTSECAERGMAVSGRPPIKIVLRAFPHPCGPMA